MALSPAQVEAVAQQIADLGFTVPVGVNLEDLINRSEAQRPACLPEPQQAIAHAWWVAYLLQNRADAARMTSTGGGTVTEEREGDLMRKVSTSTSVQSVTALADKYYERWAALAELCGNVGASAEPVRPGAITIGNAFPMCVGSGRW